jgi:hypothetical protein
VMLSGNHEVVRAQIKGFEKIALLERKNDQREKNAEKGDGGEVRDVEGSARRCHFSGGIS